MVQVIKKSLQVLALIVLLLAIASVVLVQAHVHRILGGRVDRVDHRQFAVEQRLIAIHSVSVLAPDGQRMLRDRTVVIDKGVILSVDQGEAVPEGALLVDGTDMYLIPGLFDSHVHIRRQPNDLLLYIANGVTTVRDLAGSRADLRLRQQIEEGRIGPRMIVASPQLYTAGTLEGWFRDTTRSSKNVGSARRADAVVRGLADAGYDAIKLYDNIDMQTYRAINEAAREAGMHTVGHLPVTFELDALESTGQRELAHLEELVKKLLNEFGPFSDKGGAAFLTYVDERGADIADALFANDVAVNTTLWFMDTLEFQADDLLGALRTLPLEYANPAMLEGSPYVGIGWLPGRNRFEITAGTSAEARAARLAFWRARVEAQRILLRALIDRGVTVTVGTDATVELVIAGFSLHSELESLTRAGMSPAEALRAATSAPAKLTGINAGVIEPGRVADLVLLRANPLEKIEHTSAIEAVVLDGRYLDRQELDSILEAVSAAHARSRRFDLAEFQ